jgi:hypothetical protein
MKQELLKEIEELEPIVSDYSLMKHLWSDDAAEEAMAKLSRLVRQTKMLLGLQEVKDILHSSDPIFNKRGFGADGGALVKVRPCAEEYGNKTYVGFLIGEVPLGAGFKKVDENTIQISYGSYNPAIFIPETGSVVLGAGSWWGVIKSEEDLRQISDDDISNVWYVKLLNNLKK